MTLKERLEAANKPRVVTDAIPTNSVRVVQPAAAPRVNKTGCKSCKEKLLERMKKQVAEDAKPKLLFATTKQNRACTPDVIKQLSKHYTVIQEEGRQLDLLKKHQPKIWLRWDEHMQLFVTPALREEVRWCYANSVVPVSIDFQYFGDRHWAGLMIDRYLPDARSSIYDEFNLMPSVVNWKQASPKLVCWYERYQHDLAVAKPFLEKPYAVVWTQFNNALAREQFKTEGSSMITWAQRCINAINDAGMTAVLKLSPVSRDKEISWSGNVVTTDKMSDNKSVIRGASYHIIACTSASNELVIADAAVHATGRSWFNKLGVFNEPVAWDELGKQPPRIDSVNRARWTNWWLSRQCDMSDVAIRVRQVGGI